MTRLTSYGGEHADCELVEPRSVEELHGALARSGDRHISFRGQGHAFDAQALNRDLVIGLGRLRGLTFEGTTVRAAAGEPWGAIVGAARGHGLFPHVVVTSSQASVAGTASGNCVSRFSPLYGQDGDHVKSLELVTCAGQRLHCTRDNEHSDVFFGVVGGLGCLGAITEVAVELARNTHDQVETHVVEIGSVGKVLAAISPGQTSGAVTRYAVLLPGLDRGIAYTSAYTSGEQLAPYRPVHQPRSLYRLAGELLLRSTWGTRLVWAIAERKRARRYVDPIADFTFMMDGNARLRRIGRRLGFAMRVTQQSFVLPVDTAAEFIARAKRIFGAARVVPTMSDVLYCLSDRALLSATYDLPGFFISFAFETSWRGRCARIDAALTQASKECLALGGRVHLTKNVRADPDDLAAMYATTLPTLLELRRRLDPERRIRSDFLARTFPMLV